MFNLKTQKMKTVSNNDRNLKSEYERAAMFLFNEFSKTAQSLNCAQETHVLIAMLDYAKWEMGIFLEQLQEEDFYTDENVSVIIDEFFAKKNKAYLPHETT